MSTARYYHYTSKQNAEDIIRTTEIRPTVRKENASGKAKDAFFGSGVYLTVLPPIVGQKERILKNNWRNTDAKYFEKCEMYIEIDIPAGDTKMMACNAEDNRDIRLYNGTINLENYDWSYGAYEDPDDIHNPIHCQPCKQKWKPDEFEIKRKRLADILAGMFYSSVRTDMFPPYKISQLFGVQVIQPRAPEQELKFRKIEEVMLGAWMGLIKYSCLVTNHNILAEALIQCNLPEKFEEWICESAGISGGSGYEKEILNRGFEAINWISLDEYITQKICSSFVVPYPDLSPEALKIKSELTEQHAALKERRMKNCEKCDMPTMQRCGRCRKASFCSKECQKTCWSYHKIFCTHD